MDRQDDEKLWDLLGKAPSVETSPFFARNVLRRVREQPSWSTELQSWFSLRRLVPLSALAATVVGAFIFFHNPTPSDTDKPAEADVIAKVEHEDSAAEPDAIAKIDVQDYEVVADLDDLLASDESNLWDDNSSSL